MAEIKISELPEAQNFQNENEIAIVQDWETKKLKFEVFENVFEKKKTETQINGWTTITPDTNKLLDITQQLTDWYKIFTILVYLRKWNVRQGVKFELTAVELEKIFHKIQKNMVCITRNCINPNWDNSICTIKQCVTPVQDEGWNVIQGVMHIKYQIYDYTWNIISGLDNFEWCMYAE